jgi:ADP-heptose:LPS heptosyltransferase
LSLKARPPRRVLLCRTDHLGDVILALPCAELLKRMFPEVRLSFLAQPYTAPAAIMFKDIDEVIEVEPDDDGRAIARQLADRRFDAAVALYAEKRVAWALKAAAIPIRAGIAYRWYSHHFTYRHREHRKHNLRHEAEYNLNLTFNTFSQHGQWENLLPTENLFPLSLDIPARSFSRVRQLIGNLGDQRRVVVLHPGGSGSAHRWPVSGFVALAKALSAGENTALIVTGIAPERDICREVAAAAGEFSMNLCAELDLFDLAALLKTCQLLITNSTGPLHLGRAVGTNVLGLFPSEHEMSPRRWGPYGMLENAITPPAGQGMESIRAEDVMGRAMQILR